MNRLSFARATAAVSSLAALLVAGCVAMLGDDFEIVPNEGAGAGPGGAAVGGTSAGGGGQNPGGADQGGAATGGAGATGGANLCGNDEIDDGETCDGDCPAYCIDADLCTSDTMTGSAAECTAACLFTDIVTCIDNDGCCPNGCYGSIDSDCDMRVLVVSAFGNGIDALVSALNATGEFGTVTAFYAGPDTPTADNLASYEAVLVATKFDSFADPGELGDVLAEFHDQGGRVVVANGANCTQYALGGRFVDDGYLALELGAYYPGDDPLGAIDVPGTPLMDGADGFVAFGHCDLEAAPDAVVVARYQTSNMPVVAIGTAPDGRRRVDLNLFPPPDSGAEGVALLVNALKFQ